MYAAFKRAPKLNGKGEGMTDKTGRLDTRASVLDAADQSRNGDGTFAAVNREHWLELAVDELRQLIRERGYKVPRLRVSVGWPSVQALSAKNPRHGEAWTDENTPDGLPQLYISPVLGEGLDVLGMLAHELGHAILGKKVGHKAPYVRYMVAIGLEGKPTRAVPGEELQEELAAILDKLGEYPHTAIKADDRTRQTTRLLKVMCWECGYVTRITQRWIDEGLPTCPCGALMNEGNPPRDDEGGDEERDEQLIPAGQTLMFKTDDARFEIRYAREQAHVSGLSGGKRERMAWYVTDYDAGDVPRVTALPTRQDVLGFLTAVREGVYKYPPFDAPPEPDHDVYLDDDEIEELDNPDDDADAVLEYERAELRRLRPTWDDERIEREARKRAFTDVYPDPPDEGNDDEGEADDE